MTGVVHGFEADCPLCAAARTAVANRWSGLCRCLQWVALAELIALVTGCFEPAWRAVLFAGACLCIAIMGRCALADLERLRTRRRRFASAGNCADSGGDRSGVAAVDAARA